MKVVFINTYIRQGGASIAAERLLHALSLEHVEAKMLVLKSEETTGDIYPVASRMRRLWNFLWERFIIFLHNKCSRQNLFQVSIANTGVDISTHPLVREADIIHLHWINHGMLSLDGLQKIFQLNKPVIWTLHDMWPLTGICHHSYGCERYKESCGCCPFLSSKNNKDLSFQIWQRKKELYNMSLYPVTVSNWLKEKVSESSLMKTLPIQVIGNGVDTSVFKPLDKSIARKKLDIPDEKKVIVMGAARLDEQVKGLLFLKQALNILTEKESINKNDLLLLLFGGVKEKENLETEVPTRYFGTINNPEQIATLYAASDVTVAPSLYETFGQTLIESMACGTPVVSFNHSGQTDIITHFHNGYLAHYKNTEDLATGIEWGLNYPDRDRLSASCIESVEKHFTEKIIAHHYIELYDKVLYHNSLL